MLARRTIALSKLLPATVNIYQEVVASVVITSSIVVPTISLVTGTVTAESFISCDISNLGDVHQGNALTQCQMLPNNGLMYFSVMTTSSVSFSPDQRSFINCPFNASQMAYLCGAIGSVVAVADQVISGNPTFVYGGQNGCECYADTTPTPTFPNGLYQVVPACARGVIVSGDTFPIIADGVTIDTFTRTEVNTGDMDLCLFNSDGTNRGGELGWTGSGYLRLGYRF